MEERSNAPACERGNDLIAFVYGELDEGEARHFEGHLNTCGQCTREFGSFRLIRESIAGWRQESLGNVSAAAVADKRPAAIGRGIEAKPLSALAAIRSFLDLSPLWMKAAVAVASVVFCVAALLAAARLFDKPTPAVVSGGKLYTETELKTKIEEAVSKERNLNLQNEASTTASGGNKNDKPGNDRRAFSRPGQIALATSPKARQRPLSKAEREQLAADLRLISPDDETEFELLGDRINR